MMTLLNKNRNPIAQHYSIARIVILFWLTGWFIKRWFYEPYLLYSAKPFPVVHPLFPEFFRNADVAIFFYFLPLVIIPLIFLRRGFGLKLSAIVMVVCAAILNLHIDTCNDVTFLTSSWVGLWLAWFIFHADQPVKDFRKHAKILCLCIVGMIFLGGFVGKLTPEYWSGQVMLTILSTSGKESPLGMYFLTLSAEMRGFLIMGLARLVIFLEALLVLAPFLGLRFVFILLAGIFIGFCLFSTTMIFSVIGCMLGMVLACVFLEQMDKKV